MKKAEFLARKKASKKWLLTQPDVYVAPFSIAKTTYKASIPDWGIHAKYKGSSTSRKGISTALAAVKGV